ncbi:unnamed protein product [Mytilus coruscus]|uniref:Reverse transcriptase domain-containing protein n=1 Tax=Mytilus coruscus TaxID=42192 RepID=A0A6J8CNS9_MYTCO|nr:unnamed protein product [Mytilus coruscus]
MSYHSYADDTQVNQMIRLQGDWSDLSKRLEKCLSDISDWMSANMLKCNEDKTELIIFASKHQVNHLSDFLLTFDGTVFSNITCVKHLGMYFDKTISMEHEASATIHAYFCQIRNVGRILSLILVEDCRTLAFSLVTSRLDYGKSLLCGINISSISNLQRVQKHNSTFGYPKKDLTQSRQLLSRYICYPFIIIANINFFYMCITHSLARLLATPKNSLSHTNPTDPLYRKTV